MTNEIKTWQERVDWHRGDAMPETDYELAMREEIAELRAKVESLAADAERLDWLAKSDWYVGPEPWASEGGLIEEGYHNQNGSGDALRTNIDAAKAEGKAK